MATDKACCFFGHRKIKENAELIKHDTLTVEVIYNKDRDTYTESNINGENLNIDVEVVK